MVFQICFIFVTLTRLCTEISTLKTGPPPPFCLLKARLFNACIGAWINSWILTTMGIQWFTLMSNPSFIQFTMSKWQDPFVVLVQTRRIAELFNKKLINLCTPTGMEEQSGTWLHLSVVSSWQRSEWERATGTPVGDFSRSALLLNPVNSVLMVPKIYMADSLF